ncbi:MAG: Holliday junction branch migration protein RuvA [Bacteroidia bacterium]|nr:Holliday junction branch migration protein RuvA [Bacteroidia bacterium]MCF8427409.1 Holliday junction branch migration protein RuvA [Bacteroidia bacterium]MCF8446115.1 Holliday junction branch migration protein RuvA [Bacteroidia bacterium]
MIAHIQGKVTHRSPTYVIIDCGGVGYGIQISLNTYEKMGDSEALKLLTVLSIKEDSHTLYGFADEEERSLFIQLISVSGVGTNTARMILSSIKPADIKLAILNGNWTILKTIKGIGPKTAQRLVIDLQDKLKKVESPDLLQNAQFRNPAYEEALAALVMLGFGRAEAEKGLSKIRQQNPESSVEQLVKLTLKIL